MRAIAILAAIWIVGRIISWNSPADDQPNPLNSIANVAAREDLNNKRQRLERQLFRAAEQHPHLVGEKDSNQSMPVARRRFLMSALSASEQPDLEWQISGNEADFSLQTNAVKSGLPVKHPIRTIMSLPNSGNPDRSNRMGAFFWLYARANSIDGRSISNGQYGGSQAGAILSYRLLDRPHPDLSVYTRLSSALAPWNQQEIAVGTRILPVPAMPLALHAEQRFDLGTGNDTGTAFYLTGGSGPGQVIERFSLETYAQAGYVLGQNETYFFDGSAVLQRPIADIGKTRLFIGSGVWAGGQREISRIDIGPRATIAVPIGKMSARVAVDWRLRIAGNARPASGPAITVSTGF